MATRKPKAPAPPEPFTDPTSGVRAAAAARRTVGDRLGDAVTADGDAPPAVTVETIAGLVRNARVLERDIEDAENELREMKQRLQAMLERTIPDAFDAAQLVEYKTTDGFVVRVEPFVNASIPASTRDLAFEWLESNGHAELIKTEVSIKFNAGEVDEARQLATRIGGTLERTVHPQTLRAWAREVLAGGGNLPETISVYSGARATIKRK